MSKIVFRLLENQKALAGDSHWVFPSSKSESGHLAEPRSQIERLREAIGINDFTLHDLRRTFAHHAGRQGYDLHLIKKSLNHKSGDITDVYIGGSVEIIRPVLEAISRGYLSYFDEDLAQEIYKPEEVPEVVIEDFGRSKDPSFDPETQF